MKSLALIAAMVALCDSGCTEDVPPHRRSFTAPNGCTLEVTSVIQQTDRKSSAYPARLRCHTNESAVFVRFEPLSPTSYKKNSRAFAACTSRLPVGIDLSRSYPAILFGGLLMRGECEPPPGFIATLKKQIQAGSFKLAPALERKAPWLKVAEDVVDTQREAEKGEINRAILLGIDRANSKVTLVCLTFPDIGSDFFTTAPNAKTDEFLTDCLNSFDGNL